MAKYKFSKCHSKTNRTKSAKAAPRSFRQTKLRLVVKRGQGSRTTVKGTGTRGTYVQPGGHTSIKTFRKLRVQKSLKPKQRQRILQAIEPWNLLTHQQGEQYTVPLCSGTTGAGVRYFCPTIGGFSHGVFTLRDLLEISDKITTAQPYNNRFTISDVSLQMHFTNPNNSKLHLIAYHVKCRQDIPLGNGYHNIAAILGDGFLENGLGTGNGTSNTYCTRFESTPYQSTTFCRYFKIYKTQKITMDAGATLTLNLKQTKDKFVNCSSFVDSSTGTSALTATRFIDVVRGARFILFKAYGQVANQTGANSANIVMTDPTVDMLTITRIRWRKNVQNFVTTANDAPVGVSTATDATTAIILQETDAVSTMAEAK